VHAVKLHAEHREGLVKFALFTDQSDCTETICFNSIHDSDGCNQAVCELDQPGENV